MSVCVDLCYRPLKDFIRPRVCTERSGYLWKSHVQWDGNSFCCEAIGLCDLVNYNLKRMGILFMLECGKIMPLLIKFMSQSNIFMLPQNITVTVITHNV